MSTTMKNFLNDEEGMTLVELLATIVILAIISAIGVVAIGGVIQKSKEDAGVSNVQQALNAAELFATNNKNDVEFDLAAMIEDGEMSRTDGFKTPDAVTFSVEQNGNIVETVGAKALADAGKKENKLIYVASTELGDGSGDKPENAKGIGNLERSDLYAN
jgi:type IV pilus assembly protein PilA